MGDAEAAVAAVPYATRILGFNKEDYIYSSWRKLGLPFFRVGKYLKVFPSDMDNWIAEQRR